MKEVLLTGGLGFIGRNVLAELINKDVKVHLLVRPETPLPEYAKHDVISSCEDRSGATTRTRRRAKNTSF